MSRSSTVIVASVVVVGLLSGAQVGLSGTTPVAYRGTTHGVEFVLRVQENDVSTRLTVRFTPSGEAIRRHALHTARLDAFCLWQYGRRSGLDTLGTTLRPGQHLYIVPLPLTVNDSHGPYTCGLHVRQNEPGSLSSADYVRHAIVAVRLSRAHS